MRRTRSDGVGVFPVKCSISFTASSSALSLANDGGANPTLAHATATANNLRRDKPLTQLSLAILISSQLAESRTEQSGGRFVRVTYQFGSRLATSMCSSL